MSAAAQAELVIEVTTATHPTPHETVVAVLEDPTIKEAIQRGTRKARVKKYASVTQRGRDGVREHTSDFVQATYVALLEHHAEEFAALTAEGRAGFIEKLAMKVAWHEVYPMKREVPLAEPFDGDQNDNEAGPEVFACDDISLNRQKPDWLSAHAVESGLIESIDRRAETPPEEEPETQYERMCRLFGQKNADWVLDYETRRYQSARTSADRVKYHRLRKRAERNVTMFAYM
jgi:hypothetical protein